MARLVQSVAVFLVSSTILIPLSAGEGEDKVVRFLEKRGARAFRDSDQPRSPVIAVTIGAPRGPKNKSTDELVMKLGSLKEMKTLYIHNTDLTDAGLKAIGLLQKLETVWIMRARVTDATLKELANL